MGHFFFLSVTIIIRNWHRIPLSLTSRVISRIVFVFAASLGRALHPRCIHSGFFFLILRAFFFFLYSCVCVFSAPGENIFQLISHATHVFELVINYYGRVHIYSLCPSLCPSLFLRPPNNTQSSS